MKEAPLRAVLQRSSRSVMAPRRTSGLFGTKTLLAGVGGTLTVSPDRHGIIFAEFQIPVAGPVVTGDIVRANG